MVSETELLSGPFSAADLERFVAEGYLRLDDAFPKAVADEARAILWRDLRASPENPATWPGPVARLGLYSDPPFLAAAAAPRVTAAFDQLVGSDRWLPVGAMGTFPVRFPSDADAGDTGWHIDVSFGTENPDFLQWRANVTSRGRALLMLFLFSDVTETDAPTRIRAGSHIDIARLLAPAGDEGLTLGDLVDREMAMNIPRSEVHAVGAAGTVYLCHPFLVHAAQIHRGTQPRFMAQPPLLPREPLRLDGPSPVERAIRAALS